MRYYLHYSPVLPDPFTTGGSVNVASSDPFESPIIDPAILSNSFDFKQMQHAVSAAQEFLGSDTFKGYVVGPVGPLSKVTDEASSTAFIAENARTVNHPSGTCAMGAVVDSTLRVKGITGLRIVDASVFVSSPFVIV